MKVERVTLSMSGAPVAKALTPTVGTVNPSARLACVSTATGLPACTEILFLLSVRKGEYGAYMLEKAAKKPRLDFP